MREIAEKIICFFTLMNSTNASADDTHNAKIKHYLVTSTRTASTRTARILSLIHIHRCIINRITAITRFVGVLSLFHSIFRPNESVASTLDTT